MVQKARKKEITVDLLLWKHSTTKEGLFPIKLKVTANRVTKNYRILREGKTVFLKREQWESLSNTKPRKELRELKDVLDSAKLKAMNAVYEITKGERPFNFQRFEKIYFSNESTSGFMKVFSMYLDNLLKDERIGTYRTYKCAYDAFLAFLESNKIFDLSPYDLTVDLLRDFERYLRSNRKAGKTTIGMYARTLRIIYNLCADEDNSLKEHYPFGNDKRGKYKIQDSRKGAKRGDALTIDQLRAFISLEPEKGSPQWESKLYWLFSFYCQGMNFRDIAFLKYSNIQGTSIKYVREKTKRTEEQEIIEIPLSDSMREIIIALGNPDKRPSSFVFEVIDKNEIDFLKIEATILQKIKMVNTYLKKLCADNDLPEMTTYWSRHTYANLLKSSGVPVEMIRELLGHSDIKTTEHYLKRFDVDQKRKVNEGLFSLVKDTKKAI